MDVVLRVLAGCYVPLLTLAAHCRRSLAIIMHLFVVLLDIVVLDQAKSVTPRAGAATKASNGCGVEVNQKIPLTLWNKTQGGACGLECAPIGGN